MNNVKRAGRPLVALAASAALLALAGSGAAAVGSLPGGTAISVEITSPGHNAVVPEGPLAVAGSSSVGEGEPVASTLLVYVLDLSGSTTGGVSPGICGSQNFDGIPNQIIDCEIAAAKALNNEAIALGTVGEIGAVGFGGQAGSAGSLNDAAALDLSPAGGVQNRIAPDADATGNGQPDLDDALFRVDSNGVIQLFAPFNVGARTNYWAGIRRAVEVAGASSLPNKVVVFLSDGNSNSGGPALEDALDALSGVTGITFHTFAIGNLARCTPTLANFGTLQKIADATGGTCTELDNPADAISVLPGVIGSTLDAVSLSVDGGPGSPVTTSDPLPVTGPTAATWTAMTAPLAPGPHELCATSSGSDGGGPGDVTDCITVHVNAAPSVTASAGTGAEGSAIPVSATITDDDAPTIAWTYTAGPGVDAGATCAFADASVAATTISCTDDGTYAVTVSVDDGINPAVSASAPLEVANADPTVDITSPSAGDTFPVGAPVALTTSTSDPGANDTVACSIDWGDGAVEPGCAGAHAYAAGGTYTIVVTATDDDGGMATDSVTITVNRPPSCEDVAASPDALWPPNGKLERVTLAGGSDPDGDETTLVVTGVTQDEPPSADGDAVLAGGNAVDLRAKRLGGGDGRVYEIAYMITDAHGAACTGTVIVGVPHDQSGDPAVDSGVRYPSVA